MIFQPSFVENGEFPFAEYPRPQMKRNSYFPLNGKWRYAIRKTPKTDGYDGEILVPYSPESALSGVNRQLQKDEFLFYAKTFTLPENFRRGRVLLNVGACDQVCEVFVNGTSVGRHEGGYLPFTLDITNALHDGENELTFTVRDDADTDVYGRGKQRYQRGGIWYTATSGIWQSVWLESVPNAYVKSFRLYPDAERGTLRITFDTVGEIGEICAEVKDGDAIIARAATAEKSLVLDVSACKKWTTENPELYPLFVKAGDDEIESYFGLRSFGKERKGEFAYFTVNGKRVFHNGLLDQGYWKDGLYTPPSNKAMYDEIRAVKDLGFNMLRKHIKTEPYLWYYYCDVLGVLVWQDMINGGAKYKELRIMLAPFINLHIDDQNYKAMGRSERSKEQYYKEAYGLIDTLFNCVSLCLWTPFNEAWGQFDAKEVCEKLQAYDNTRLFDHASGWQDKGAGDVRSRHIYFRKLRAKNDKKRVLAVTEFGGYSFALDGHTFTDKIFGYKLFKDGARFANALEKLYDTEVIPLIETQGLCGAVYTQLTDVEDEINGLFTYDRVLKTDGERIRKMNERLYHAFEKE